jgi:hypothetical protein
MQWVLDNWVWILFGGGMIAMHMFGHGGHGGHAKSSGGDDHAAPEPPPEPLPAPPPAPPPEPPPEPMPAMRRSRRPGDDAGATEQDRDP